MKQKTKPLTPQQYIKTRARTLPIYACYINENWKESGLAHIIVARKHTTGNLTFGIYLVDLFALGTKDTIYKFNEPESVFMDILKKMGEQGIMEADYVLVHNIIYGANEFAEEHGFKVCKEFALTQYILEEDDENIELMEIEFGMNGKPFLIG